MRALLDTHTFLWWIDDSDELSHDARQIIENSENTILVSAVVGWEIAIKTGLGRLEIAEDPERFIPEQIARNSFGVMPIQMSHALHTHDLPDHHRDPFDRLLVSQSQMEGLPIITRDTVFKKYEVETFW